MNITEGIGIKVTCPSLERLRHAVKFNDDLKVVSETVEMVFKLVQVAAADHPELDVEVTKSEILIQQLREWISDLHKEIEEGRI